MLLFLTGMPGSGKTYWMQQLAAELQYGQVDLDAYIEKMCGATIPELFAKGESYFRDKEHEALAQVITHSPSNTIVSTGGGLPAYARNRALMQASGKIIYLASAVSRLAERVRLAPGKRPLLISESQAELEAKLENLLQQRAVFYEQADIKIEVDNLSLATFAAQLRKHIF